MSSASEHLPLFVYGTLKRGGVRETKWPHPPAEVRSATCRAALYDMGPYPAIGEGDDLVAGELWFLPPEHLDDTLAVLDEIEGFGQGGTDLYVRRIVECEDDAGQTQRAYTYFYANERWLLSGRRIPPGDDGLCRWTGPRKS